MLPLAGARRSAAPHRDDAVTLALLRQVSDAAHEEPVGCDVGLARLDHAAAQLDELQTRGRARRSRGPPAPGAGTAGRSSGPVGARTPLPRSCSRLWSGAQHCPPSPPACRARGPRGATWALSPGQQVGAGQGRPEQRTRGRRRHVVPATGQQDWPVGGSGALPHLPPLPLP